MTEYIEREVVIRELRDVYEREFPTADGAFDLFANRIMPRVIKNIPAAEVEPVRHGTWIDKQEDDLTEGMWRCSACGEDFYFSEDNPSGYGANYCPACGARMDLGGADNGTI